MATTTKRVPVVCGIDECPEDLESTITINDEGTEKVSVLRCPVHGEFDRSTFRRETVRAYLTGLDGCGPADVGQIWVPA